MINRHSIRCPNEILINKYKRNLELFKNLLTISIAEKQQIFGKQPGNYDDQLIREFLEWQLQWCPKDENQITNKGIVEGRSIVRHLKSIYPNLFDGSKADIKFGFTSRLRTAQSGMDFLHEIDNFGKSECNYLRQSPILADLENPKQANYHWSGDECAKRLLRDYYWPNLEFQIKCKEIYGGKMPNNVPELKEMESMDLFEPLQKRLENSNRVFFEFFQGSNFSSSSSSNGAGIEDKGGPDKRKELFESIFDVCKFETAILGKSIWCSLLKQEELDQLEYIVDAEAYHLDAYGESALAKQACPVAKDLLETLALASAHYNGELTAQDFSRAKTFLHFSHSDSLKKLLAVFKLFNEPTGYTQLEMKSFVEGKIVPENRDWRTSILVPFSSNLSFVLYKKPSSDHHGHKIIVLLNERPIHVEGCSSIDCNLDQFLSTYSHLLDCDLFKICAPPQ